MTTKLIDHLKSGRPISAKLVKEIVAELEKLQWRTDAPPRDRVFLARLGWPWPVICHYSPFDGDFVWAMVQVNMVDGEWDDYYFETEHSPESEIKAWMDVPKWKE